MILALLLAAAQPPTLAVLEFRSKVEEKGFDAGYFADKVRSTALELLPSVQVMTRENVVVLLEAQGKKLEDCEGECEVDTGRLLGADYVVTGEIFRVGSAFKLNLKMHETASAKLLSGAQASGKDANELDKATAPAVEKLLASIRPQAAPFPEKPAAPKPVVQIVPGVGFSDLRVGDATPEAVLAKFGRDAKVYRTGDDRSPIMMINYSLTTEGEPRRDRSLLRTTPTQFDFKDGRLEKIQMMYGNDGIVTPEGLRLGMKPDEVKKLYGEPVPNEYVKDQWSFPARGLGVLIAMGKVMMYSVEKALPASALAIVEMKPLIGFDDVRLGQAGPEEVLRRFGHDGKAIEAAGAVQMITYDSQDRSRPPMFTFDPVTHKLSEIQVLFFQKSIELKGLRVGSKTPQVRAALGEPAASDGGVYSYPALGLKVLLSGDMVTGFILSLPKAL